MAVRGSGAAVRNRGRGSRGWGFLLQPPGMTMFMFPWIALDAPEASKTARDAFRSPDHTVHVSAASVWEITLKHGLGRLSFPEAPPTYVPALRERHEIEALPIAGEDVLRLHRLPRLHHDTFDRILICQAVARAVVLLTPDPPVAQYPVRVPW